MAAEVFIDTGGFFALLSAEDGAHKACTEFLARAAKARRRFVTTDYVLDETATLLKVRGLGRALSPFFDLVFSSKVCRVEWMNPEWFDDARQLLTRRADHGYSFTDCTSFVLMERLGLREVLTKDRHFAEAGFALVP